MTEEPNADVPQSTESETKEPEARPSEARRRKPDIPYGLWSVLALIEHVLANALEEGEADHNLIVANLAQFDDVEMPHIQDTLARAAIAASGVRSVLEHLLSTSRKDRIEVEWVRTAGAEAERRMQELIQVTLLGPGARARRARRRRPNVPEAVWTVHEILSLIQSVICTTEMGDRSIVLVLARLRHYGIDRLIRLLDAMDLVILVMGLALEELRMMMKTEKVEPPRQDPSPEDPVSVSPD
jgi:hypothetical protein